MDFEFGGQQVHVLVTSDWAPAEKWFSEESLAISNTSYGISAKTTAPDDTDLRAVDFLAVATEHRVIIYQFNKTNTDFSSMEELSFKPGVRFITFSKEEALQLLHNKGLEYIFSGWTFDAKDVIINIRKNTLETSEENFELLTDKEESVFKKALSMLKLEQEEFAMPPSLEESAGEEKQLTTEQAKYHAAKAWICAKLGLLDEATNPTSFLQ